MTKLRLLTMSLFVSVLVGCGDTDLAVFQPQGSSSLGTVQQALADDGIQALTPAPAESAEMVELGRMLFFDKELSGNRNISCATCHHPTAGTGDALPVSIGEGGVGLAENRAQAAGHLIPRNAPAVFNLAVPGANRMFWDGRVSRDPVSGVLETPEPGLNGTPTPTWAPYVQQLTTALAAQAMFPVTSREEMRGDGNDLATAGAISNQALWEAIMLRLVGTEAGGGGIAGYRTLFQAAYPSVTSFDDFTFAHAARAIAAFETSAYTKLDTPLDLYLAGDHSALSDSEKRGAVLFCGRANCAACHNGPHLSDFQNHAIAAPQVGPGKEPLPFRDRGRFLVTNSPSDLYRFRTPPLRNVALTGPWTHAGAYTSLEAVVRHHLDPTTSLLSYDVGQLPVLFQSTFDADGTRNNARLAAVSPLLGAPVSLTQAEFSDLMAFLHALTSPSSLTLIQDVPDSVPSGLPVAD